MWSLTRFSARYKKDKSICKHRIFTSGPRVLSTYPPCKTVRNCGFVGVPASAGLPVGWPSQAVSRRGGASHAVRDQAEPGDERNRFAILSAMCAQTVHANCKNYSQTPCFLVWAANSFRITPRVYQFAVTMGNNWPVRREKQSRNRRRRSLRR